MIDDKSLLTHAQNALEELARATGIAYSNTPKIGALSLFSDYRSNVYAMLVTGLDAEGNVERGVTPYGDPPMTAREFAVAAQLAEAAVYALYQFRPNGRIAPERQSAASQNMADAAKETDPKRKARLLLDALTTKIGLPHLDIVENAFGLVSIAAPSPFGSQSMPVGHLASALAFALDALYHHNRTRQ